MIFNDNFDKSLWLILKNDRKNRNRILDFIRSIPHELVVMIQESLVEYEKYMLENEGISLRDREVKYFVGDIYSSSGGLYSFNIDVKNDILSIIQSFCQDCGVHSVFNIRLNNLNRNMDLFEMQDLGSISFCKNDEVMTSVDKATNVDYSIMNTVIGNVVLFSVDKGIIKLCGIENGDIPDYDVDNVSNKLVRTKKRDNGKDRKNV